ncbi:MAG: dTDP-4-dehydrorhamnose reductase [Candidatus Eisenbacteria bacterium]|uniref:dTDP-4-dehydrorhamnose reductase n=1 Tax=Eiseniibacteriota bacterium TaxID=2212470 RepID=A0A948RZY9_UNCEI|nr:dTDP-4-dehydrorhamnose reductase [Candidatus Eisenbacteria bacterium]MBU1948837.1 dTDP-4-dehydrorhamnose reductase [Candidatus Eisenbacteria bacterium]MBU2692292.1 dTDP-4-dehydrorhamnose reductase [Candidatus Eisenbacteria bacterium]
MARVLVTGARGMLGGDLCPIWRSFGYEVLETDIEDLDVRNQEKVRSVFETFQPDILLHLAAETDVDGCELRPDETYQTNTLGTRYLAMACRDSQARMVYISTASVFSGKKPTPYTEFDIPDPLSAYSGSKLAGEKIVQNLVVDHYICRAGWMFGGGAADKKFVAKIMELARSRPELKVVNDKFGTPTYTKDFAAALHTVIQRAVPGIYHLANEGTASRFEIAQAILKIGNITTCKLIPVSSAHFPLAAARPRMEAIENLMLKLLGLPSQPYWREALERYIHERLS